MHFETMKSYSAQVNGKNLIYFEKLRAKTQNNGDAMVAPPSDPGSPQLPRFYAGRELFITGATGFMGKVLVERLLSTCPDVGRLHLLIRDKREHPPHKRLAQLKQSQVFDNIRARSPRQLDKLVAVAGDVSLPHLGLDAQHIAELREVSVVFHVAATVKFWEPLGVALANNVSSVTAVMELCDKLPALEALVQVSTAFTNTEQRHIEEKVYPAPAQLPHVLSLVEALPQDILHDITPRYIFPKPNTYVFTKALAEVAVEQRPHRTYSVAICRPSIVVSSHRAPFPGWVEGMSGATGIVIGIGQGVIRVCNIDMNARADLVPVDIAIDTMLAVAWETATDKLAETRVYYCGSHENPVTWGQFYYSLERNVRQHPFNNTLYYPSSLAAKNRYLYKVLEVLLQTAPLHAADYIFKKLGVNTPYSLIAVSRRLAAVARCYSFVTCSDWSFGAHHARALRERLRDSDGHLYHLDITCVNWEEHMTDYVRGVRSYLLQQKEDSLEQAKTHMNRLRKLHYGVQLLLMLLCSKLLVSKIVRTKGLLSRFLKRLTEYDLPL